MPDPDIIVGHVEINVAPLYKSPDPRVLALLDHAERLASELAAARERAAKAEQRARAATADAARLHAALALAVDHIGQDMRYIAAADERVMRDALADGAGAALAAVLDAWCELFGGAMPFLSSAERVLYELWRGKSDAG